MQYNDLRQIPGFERYAVAGDGSIWSIVTCEPRKLSCWKTESGCMATIVSRKTRTVGSLVCLAFHGPCPEGCVAFHKNGIVTDDRPENLEWQPRSVVHARERNHVIPEGLLAVIGYSGYYADKDGCVWSAKRRTVRKLSPRASATGYLQVTLGTGHDVKQCNVHTLVCEAFHGKRPEGMVCRHLNSNPLDNRAENLTWGTPTENALDRRKHGNEYSGEKHHNVRFNLDAVRIMRHLSTRLGWSTNRIAKCFDAPYGAVQSVVTRKSWKHVDDSIEEMEKFA